MAQPKPSLAARLMERHPIPGVSTSSTSSTAAGSDALAAASSAYAKHASNEGATGPWWRVWRAIERTRGHRLSEALVPLKPEARRWFALWSFGRGRTKEGATAYRAYLAHPGRIGPFDAENAIYLGHVALRKAPSEVVRIADELMAKTSTNRDVSRIVLATLLATGETEELRRRYPRPMGATLHDGEAWARYALAAASAKAASESAFALTMCAKLGVGSRNDTALLDLLLKTLSLSPTEWSHLRAPWDYPSDDYTAKWLAHRGARPEATSDASPHAYGGDPFAMPPCPGCGHRMQAFFVFDVAAEPSLRARLPGWTHLPLVGCVDCCLWLMRRDFRVNQDARTVEVLGVQADANALASYGKALKPEGAPIPRQNAVLRAIPSDAPPENDRTQVGGEPDWVQDFERAFCPLCHDEMVFVAALGSYSKDFVPELTINNGSGYQYHFACAPCGTLAVFGQNT